MELAVGTRLRSAVCETQVIVVRAPGGDVDLRCGGVEMLPLDAPASSPSLADAGQSNGGTAIGKRYVAGGLKVLCTKAGSGDLAIGDVPMRLRDAKSLPSSD